MTFAEHASAAKALQVADSSMLFGRPLSVRWYSAERSQEGRQQEVEHQHLASFLHGNMAHDVLLQQLAERAAWTSALHVAGSSGGASLASEQQPGSAAGSWLNMGAWLNMSQKPLQEVRNSRQHVSSCSMSEFPCGHHQMWHHRLATCL